MGKVITHGLKTHFYEADVVNLFLDTYGYADGQFITSVNVNGSLSIERVNRTFDGKPGVLDVHIA